MHYLISAAFILLFTAGTVPAVIAQSAILPSSCSNSNSQLTPASLVILAHRGYFKQQNIPSYGALSAAYNLKQITAEEIVQAAITVNRLSAECLTNQSYLKAVAVQLKTLENIR